MFLNDPSEIPDHDLPPNPEIKHLNELEKALRDAVAHIGLKYRIGPQFVIGILETIKLDVAHLHWEAMQRHQQDQPPTEQD